MSFSELEHPDFDRWLSQSETAARKETVSSDDHFVRMMQRAIDRGRESATPGIFVDDTYAIGAIRVRGAAAVSSCGSPSAMCIEGGSSGHQRARHGSR
jgi:hypothetical protein